MDEDNRDPDPTTMSRKELVDEVLRLRVQVAQDQDYYRQCRDKMAEKLQSYNEKFNLQEEVIAELIRNSPSQNSSATGELLRENRETARVPQLVSSGFKLLPAFNPENLF